jgi:hypothetical protein
VNILQGIGNQWFICMTLCLSLIRVPVKAQQTDMSDLPANRNKIVIVPVFTEREKDVGSIYFARKWSKGTVELSNHRRIPEPDQSLLFNFDKLNNIIFVMDQYGKQWSYPIDSVSGFDLTENGTMYSFEKVPWISKNYFLMPIYQSEKGYSLYKRLFTKYTRASYTNAGYYSEGKKYDEYVDNYEYYLTYPGNTNYRKLTLKENAIRRALKEESSLLQEFFTLHDNEINEQSLLGIIQYIDDKKFPE